MTGLRAAVQSSLNLSHRNFKMKIWKICDGRKHGVIGSIKLLLMLLCASIRPTGSQEQYDAYTLSPAILSTTNNPLLTVDLPASSNNNGAGMTFCFWFIVSYFRRPSVLFSLRERDAMTWDISIAVVPNGILLKLRGSIKVIPKSVLPLDGNHFCICIQSGTVSLYHNGELIHGSYFPGKALLAKPLRAFAGGGEQWPSVTPISVGTPTIPDQSVSLGSNPEGGFAGTIIDPGIWAAYLSEGDVARVFRCEAVNASSQNRAWVPEGESIEKSTLGSPNHCLKDDFDYFFFSKPLSFENNFRACQRLRLNLVTPRDSTEFNQFKGSAALLHDQCGRGKWYAWLGINPKGPRGGCEALTESGQEKSSCHENICSGCQLALAKRVFVLRGLCPLEEADLSFIVRKEERKTGYQFHGIERYSIIEEGLSWTLKDMALESVVASTNISSNDPVGIREWTMHTELCGRMKGDLIMASLSSCDEFNETMCSDGTCLPVSKRCDSFPDCSDSSDESKCEAVRTTFEFISKSPPSPSPTPLRISINVIRIIATPPRERFTLLYETSFEWKDPRITLANLNPEGNFTTLPKNAKLWLPNLSVLSQGTPAFPDSENVDAAASSYSFSSSKPDGRSLTAKPFGKPLSDHRESPFMDSIYSGKNTSLFMTELATQTVDCEFDFTFFPFDEHICYITLVIFPWSASRVVLKQPFRGGYTGPVKIQDYNIVRTKMEGDNVKIDGLIHSGAIINIHLARRSSWQVLAVYLPTVILLIMNCCTLWMTGYHGTSMRMRTSCFIVVIIMMDWILLEKHAPETGQVSAVDAWMCFCTVFSLLHVCIHILLEIYTEEDQPDPFSRFPSRVGSSKVKDVKPIDANSLYEGIIMRMAQMETVKMWSIPYWILFIGRVVSPVLLVFFNITYWPFVLYFCRKELQR